MGDVSGGRGKMQKPTLKECGSLNTLPGEFKHCDILNPAPNAHICALQLGKCPLSQFWYVVLRIPFPSLVHGQGKRE
jgi:hypothetical protein